MVLSLAGHDRGLILMVIGKTDDGVLLLSDGKLRTLAAPKKKKPKHAALLPVAPVGTLPNGNKALRQIVKACEEQFLS